VIIGEVLFDVFDDGGRVLGGAPFNVAWHLRGFGLEPLFLSRVGDDDDGRTVTAAMLEWGMDPRGLQIDPEAATGIVHVHNSDGEPIYDIVPERAFDRLEVEPCFEAMGSTTGLLLYHGTLAARAEPSNSTIAELRQRLGLPIFIDVNLREPWWIPRRTSSFMSGAAWIKLNGDELKLLAPILSSAVEAENGGVQRSADRLRRATGARQIIVTRGEEGAMVVAADGAERDRPSRTAQVIDTVGAGDAFSAVWIVGLARGWSTATTLRRALGFAARVCSIRGATTTDRNLYRDVMTAWDREGYDFR
jgi:fructokinase